MNDYRTEIDYQYCRHSIAQCKFYYCISHSWSLLHSPTVSFSTRSSADADKPARPVSRSVKVTKHGTIRYVSYDFLLVCYSNFVRNTHRFWDIRLQNAVTLKIGLRIRRGHSKCHHSIQRMTSWRSIVTWLYLVSFLRYSMSKSINIPVKGQSR